MIKKKSPIKIILVIVVVFAVFAVIAGSMTHNSDDMQGSNLNSEEIDKVRNFSPEGANGITFGEAYSYFYSDAEWGFFKEEEHEEPVVEFAGGCTYMDEPGTVYLQFILNAKGEIKSYYGQFEYEGEEKKVDLEQEVLWDLFFQPFVDYAEEELDKPLSDDDIAILYGETN